MRLLGLQEVAQKGDPAAVERFSAKGWPDLYAEKNRDHVLVGGVKVFLEDNIDEKKGKLTVTRRDYDKVLVPLLWRLPPQLPGSKRIVLDPGHGGKDPGIVSAALGYTEKAATLDTALRIKLLLEKRGFEVILTREKDTFVELEDRPAAANNSRPTSSSASTTTAAPREMPAARGLRPTRLTPAGQYSTNKASARADITAEPANRFDTFNLLLAWNVQRSLVKATGAEDRGVRRSRFAVLRPLNCPGILVEGGFISSRGRRSADRQRRLPPEARRGHWRRRDCLRDARALEAVTDVYAFAVHRER
ncbi:probable cell wall amidase LytH [Verrucomicrobiota bacterium]|nr:probable cell wall amidase LytH [Verrucomicrobiota bacterium]